MKIEIDSKDIIHIYNSGYHAGHHNTVEGRYTDIFSCDMDTYHEDVVFDLIAELDGHEPKERMIE